MREPDHQFIPHFLTREEAVEVMDRIMLETPWRDDFITLFGTTHPVPRRTALFGDSRATYTYSRIRMDPLPWTPLLSHLKSHIELVAGHTFNVVLINLYRDGRDSNGWHADDEPELGDEPVIASLSLGTTRDMLFRRRDKSHRLTIPLTSGSLLVMHGDAQRDWLHCIPKRSAVFEPRINLTFRTIVRNT